MTAIPRKRGRPAKSREVVPEELLRQAFNMFAKEGFEAASLRKLAADSGVDFTLFRHYFGTKDQLWRAAVVAELTPLAEQLLQVLKSPQKELGVVDALRQNITAALLLAIADRDRAGVLFKEPGDAERRDWLYSTFVAPYQAQVDEAFKAALEQKLIRPVPFESLHAMIIGVARMMVDPGMMSPRMAPLLKDKRKLKAYVEGAVAVLFEGLQAK
ncbi:TetR/AcrR family transcriptional regulator [Oleomonas cavernae]|uniref:TetR/AcrR family transcriptional regulator n=1 Tax=Oleomonas cavernae TaxID=2320859 RepID=A0A418WGY4_9PROT|nr:TetR/AcrR family transcriptional regulator [Oleomonas cavernae]RJF89306.1 TetR/AcrR family transcriptional regulator [Oleomonas cavernae]